MSGAEIQRIIDAANGVGASPSAAASAVASPAPGADGTPSHISSPDSPRPGTPRCVSVREQWSRLLLPLENWAVPAVSSALVRFKRSWEAFVDSVLREWKTLNVVSALLLTCAFSHSATGTALTTRITAQSARSCRSTRPRAIRSRGTRRCLDSCARSTASASALLIVRFGSLRSVFKKASRLAEEAQRSCTSVWWNVWVLLALPAVWLAWCVPRS
jgi:hypothetical protein